MQVSYSRVECFKKCPYQYKLRYIDNLDTLPTDDPASPLILGHALHTGIEKDIKAAIDEYYNAYPVISDAHINEVIKLEYWLPLIKEILPEGQHEIKIENDDFIGFMDLIVPVKPPVKAFVDGWENDEMTHRIEYADGEWFDLYDFKYSNNVSNYKESGQLHVYKHYFEKLNPGKKIRHMYFLFVPKSQLRMKYKNKTNPRDETIEEFRKRTLEDLKGKKLEVVRIKYDPMKVIDFMEDVKHMVETDVFPKSETRLCDWCNFKKFCQEGIDYELIQRR